MAIIGRLRRVAAPAVKRVIRHPAVLGLAALGFALAGRVHRHPLWWATLGRVQEARHEPAKAATAYGRAAQTGARSTGSSGRWHVYAAGRRVQALVGLKDWAAAIAVGEPLARRPWLPAALALPLAQAYREVGDWPAAAEVLRRAFRTDAAGGERAPDRAVVVALVDTLELQSSVPFSVGLAGDVRAAPDAGREAAWTEAVKWRRWLVDNEGRRAGSAQKLGLLYERAGRLAEAATAYEQAMAHLAAVDEWWTIRAAHEWAYRLAHVRGPAGPAPARGVIGRQAVPTGPSPSEDPIGYFDVLFTLQGLSISGFVVQGDWREVEILVDGQVLKTVMLDTSVHRPRLNFPLTNGPLREFPEQASLTIRAHGRPLVTTAGTEALQLRLPGGTGAIFDKLAGAKLAKKGYWAASGDTLAQRQEKYLQVYQRTRDALEAQGRRLFLCYGTLLGCHREGRFIPGDDDFDVSYVSHAPDPDAFRRECYQLARGLLRQGLDITFAPNGRLFKAGLEKVWIDISPMWFYRGRAYGYDAHAIGPDAIEPVRTTEFLGGEVLVPGRPEILLADTYGPDWRTPRSDFVHYRSPADNAILSRTWSKPSEVREFMRLAEADRARHPGAGAFVGVGVPAYPGFSWLIPPDGGEPNLTV